MNKKYLVVEYNEDNEWVDYTTFDDYENALDHYQHSIIEDGEILLASLIVRKSITQTMIETKYHHEVNKLEEKQND